MADEYTFTISYDDQTDEVTIPAKPFDLIAPDDQEPAETAGDFLMMLLSQELHGVVHHARGEVPDEVTEAEAEIMDAFEDRYGESFADVTGHDH